MLEAAREIVDETEGLMRSDLDVNRSRARSVVKLLEIFGEAASRVTAPVRAQLPEIPWRDVIDTRNRLIHGYYDVELDIVWSTAINDVPPMIEPLARVLATLEY